MCVCVCAWVFRFCCFELLNFGWGKNHSLNWLRDLYREYTTVVCVCNALHINFLLMFFGSSVHLVLVPYTPILGAPPPWHGLKMAVELSPVCPQNLPSLNNSQQHLTNGRYDQLKRLLRYLQTESEDCLFLNLYVPKWCKYFIHSHFSYSGVHAQP